MSNVFFSILCLSHLEGKHKLTTLILLFTHKLLCGLKGVHPLLGKQEALKLAIMGQSLEKDFLKCFPLIESKCLYTGYLLLSVQLAVPKKNFTSQAMDFKD